MRVVFFLIPFFLVAGFGIYQDVSALETITGYDYFDTDNGDGTRRWSTHEPYILENGIWVPFINSGLTTQNHFATVTLNTDGSYTFAGKFTDRIIAKYADVSDLNSWIYLTSLNNDTPDNNWDGSGFVTTKQNSVGKLEYKYILNNGKWKTQLEATNFSVLTSKAFGFDQIIDLESDTISFGGVTRNLDNFHGQTFSKQFLIDNKGKVLDLLNGVNFDFDLGFENLYSVTVYDTGVNKSRLVFDYRTSVPLLPGETLIIDPTFGYTASSAEVRIASPSATGAACSTTGTYSVYGANEIAFIPRSGDNAFCTRMTLEWDTTSIPDTSTVTNVNFRYDVTSAPYTIRNCDFTGMSVAQPSTSGSPRDLWNNIGNSTVYVDNSVTCTTVANNKVLDLGASADSDLQAKLAVNWFAVGIKLDSEVRDAGNDYGQLESGGTWDLEVTYTDIPAPDSITDLTADTVGTTTASLSFTPPNLNGESLINYMLNVTTPQASPVTTFWMNGSASPFSVIGLTEGTDYSASASAYTAGGGNWTLANVLNFTTNELPAGTFSVDNGNVGDTLRMNGTVTLSASIPLPANATALKLYKDNVLVKTDTIFDSIPSLGSGVALDSLWYRITDGSSHQYALVVTVNNDAGSVDIMGSPNATVTREYNPTYLPAVDNPATQGNVNATVTRFDDEDGILLKVNRIGVSTGDTWQIECISQTNSEAAQTKNQSQTWQGDWQNATNVGYFNTTYTGFANSHAYITCFNEDELFGLTSYTNSSLALLGIELFDQSYGSMLGVPVGVFFLVMTAGMANKRTAPTFIIVITGIAGTMATIGFFSFDPLVWGLALVTAMLGIFVNQKIF